MGKRSGGTSAFDRYVDEQKKDPAFAAEYQRAGVALLRRLIAAADPGDRAAFQAIVAEAIRLGVTTEEEMAEGLDVSRPTVRRWANGTGTPADGLRPFVYRWIAEKLGR